MPSTYTTNNGLEKIGTGEQSGTWGDTTNLNFDILDQALDGLVTVTATDTGSGGSPNTLPITDGSVSDGRNRLIIITDGGDLGGSVYYQLTPADAEKIVFLRNSLSGSQDLILFQGTYNAARDLIVPAGKDVIVKFSGTGTSTAVVAPVFADLSLDAATIASADINGGTIDGVTIGVTSVATVINVDNLKLDGNTLSSTDTNGNVVLAPNGDGDVQLDADTVRVGDNNNDVTITTNGTGDLTLNTNSGTDSGSIEIQDGANTNIIITADGTGKLELANGDITTSASSGSDAAGQDLTIQAGASTGNAAGGDMIFQTTPAGAGSGSVLNSYTTVLTLTDDSKMQIGTSTAVDSILDEDDMNSDSDTALATQQSIKAYVDAQVGTVDTLAEVLANGNTTGGNDILFGDNDKAIFGAGSDLQIYSNGANSFISESGSGSLFIDGDNISIRSAVSGNYAKFLSNGAAEIYYAGSPTLATTSTGVDITGVVTTLAGSASAPAYSFGTDTNNGMFKRGTDQLGFSAGGTEIIAVTSTGMFVDTIGGKTTNATLSLRGAGTGGVVVNDDGADRDFRVESDSNANMLFVDAGANGGAGRLSIGGATQSGVFTVQGGTTTEQSMWVYGQATGKGGRLLSIRDTRATTGTDGSAGIHLTSSPGTDYVLAKYYDGSTSNFMLTDQNGNQYISIESAADIVINQDGSSGKDFRVESDGNANAFFVDAGQDTVHIGGSGGNYVANIYANTVNSPTGTLYVNAALNNSGRGVFIDAATRNSSEDSTRLLQVRDRHAYNAFTINVGGAVEVNDDGGDWGDFRVESDNNSNMLLVDAGADRVIVGTNSSPAKFGPAIFQAGGFAIRTLGVGSSATSTGISVNAGGNGMTALVMVNRNTGAGAATASGTYMLKFYYDGNNTPAVTHIAGDNFITFGQDGSNNLTMANPAAGNCNATLLMNG